MNWSDNQIQWVALPYYFPVPKLIENYYLTHKPEDAMDKNTLEIFENEIKSGDKVWIITPADSPGADLELEILWLKERAVDYQCKEVYDSNYFTQFCFFHIK
jgi:hypothetical protein